MIKQEKTEATIVKKKEEIPWAEILLFSLPVLLPYYDVFGEAHWFDSIGDVILRIFNSLPFIGLFNFSHSPWDPWDMDVKKLDLPARHRHSAGIMSAYLLAAAWYLWHNSPTEIRLINSIRGVDFSILFIPFYVLCFMVFGYALGWSLATLIQNTVGRTNPSQIFNRRLFLAILLLPAAAILMVYLSFKELNYRRLFSSSTPPDKLYELYRHASITHNTHNTNVLRMLAENPICPSNMLRDLSRNEDSYTRMLVARNLATQKDVLQSLAIDHNLSVKISVAMHPTTPIDVLITLSKHKNKNVHDIAMQHLGQRMHKRMLEKP